MRLNLTTLLVTIVISVALGEAVLRIKNSAINVYDIEMWRYSKLLKQPSANPVLGSSAALGWGARRRKVVDGPFAAGVRQDRQERGGDERRYRILQFRPLC